MGKYTTGATTVNRLRNEPALLIGLAEAVLALVVAFGVDLTAEQAAAVLAVIVALGSVLTREVVTPYKNPTLHPDVERDLLGDHETP